MAVALKHHGEANCQPHRKNHRSRAREYPQLASCCSTSTATSSSKAWCSRSDAQIYKSYSLKVVCGQTVALVGASGSGKSTAISLFERFDDPSTGVVTFDCMDLRELSLPWVHKCISLVSQATVRYAVSIVENIAVDKPGATLENVVETAKKVNAVDFVSNFPGGFDTNLGDRGAQVSGDHNQRIAIVCPILRGPEVLLLAETTGTLGNKSKRVGADVSRLLAEAQVAHWLLMICNRRYERDERQGPRDVDIGSRATRGLQPARNNAVLLRSRAHALLQVVHGVGKESD